MLDGMKPEKRNLIIERILRVEWEMFQAVDGLTGKADCQEEWPTFHIMRYSYYNAWSDQMLRSYVRDLDEALQENRNLVMEKYAYMMEYTDPEYYNSRLKPYLPECGGETAALIDTVAEYLVACEKEFALRYPKLGRKGRPADHAGDSAEDTSAETYVRGELRTYSKYTLKYFVDYIEQCRGEGVNFTFLVKEKMVRMYGYDSLDDAERKM